jgi:hypothetical protein
MKRRLLMQVGLLLAAVALQCPATRAAEAQSQVAPPHLGEAAPPPVAAQPPFVTQLEGRYTFREDGTGTEIFAKRIKVLTSGAVQTQSQQQFEFIEGMQTLDIVEAYTEKPDGRRILVGPANIITRDGASGLALAYVRDLKVRTLIFPDVSVGDTLVMTSKRELLQGEFAGQFTDFDIFSRSLSLSSVHITIEAPASLNLAVRATGDHTTDKFQVVDAVERHEITVAPEPYEPDEPGAVSPLDREPALFVSTFPSYEALGAAYGETALPKSAVTPGIAVLADEITRNVDDRRAQTSAIDAWVKKNIRYVAVFLSTGRVVPHDASVILRNRFGDCKDKVTLMAALLAAKGITSEVALINLGNAYSLPEPPTLAALNHVILFLPEFGVYDDPTASEAAFGVLAPEAYDKPVVRVSAAGVKLARTPAMNPAEHVSHSITKLDFAGDGAITGQTEEDNSGVLGMALRTAAGMLQQLGPETAVQRMLEGYNTPGTGHIDLGNSSETRDPFVVQSSFALSNRFKPPAPGGSASVPFGMPLTVRPGNFLFGRRMSGRRFAFPCYGGTQIEDIEATFDKALPLPAPLPSVRIDNPLFTYESTYSIEDGTLKVHRQFISRVPGQSCPPETEARIAVDLDRVRADVNSAYLFPRSALTTPAPADSSAPPIREISRVAVADQQLRVAFFYDLYPDCSLVGVPTVRVIDPPKNGRLNIENGPGFPSFPANNPRFKCNDQRVDGAVMSYMPNSGFTGGDMITVEAIYPDGSSRKRRYAIEVK